MGTSWQNVLFVGSLRNLSATISASSPYCGAAEREIPTQTFLKFRSSRSASSTPDQAALLPLVDRNRTCESGKQLPRLALHGCTFPNRPTRMREPGAVSGDPSRTRQLIRQETSR